MGRLCLRSISYQISPYKLRPHRHLSNLQTRLSDISNKRTSTTSAMIFSLAFLFVSVLTLPYAYTHSTIQSAAITSSKHTSHTRSSATSVPRINYPYSQIFPQEELPPYNTPQSISQSATITSSTNASHLQTSSTAPAKSTAASHRGAGDPCGPQGIQTDFESTLGEFLFPSHFLLIRAGFLSCETCLWSEKTPETRLVNPI